MTTKTKTVTLADTTVQDLLDSAAEPSNPIAKTEVVGPTTWDEYTAECPVWSVTTIEGLTLPVVTAANLHRKQSENAKVVSVLAWARLYEAAPKGKGGKKTIVAQSGWSRPVIARGVRLWEYMRAESAGEIPAGWLGLGIDTILSGTVLPWERRNDPVPTAVEQLEREKASAKHLLTDWSASAEQVEDRLEAFPEFAVDATDATMEPHRRAMLCIPDARERIAKAKAAAKAYVAWVKEVIADAEAEIKDAEAVSKASAPVGEVDAVVESVLEVSTPVVNDYEALNAAVQQEVATHLADLGLIPAPRKCGKCGGPGHNARTCKS